MSRNERMQVVDNELQGVNRQPLLAANSQAGQIRQDPLMPVAVSKVQQTPTLLQPDQRREFGVQATNDRRFGRDDSRQEQQAHRLQTDEAGRPIGDRMGESQAMQENYFDERPNM